MAKTVPLVGEWVAGDSLKAFEYRALNLDGAAFDLTGYTVRLQGRSRDRAGDKIDIAGTLSATPTDGIATFASIGTALTLATGKRSEIYEARVVATRTLDGLKTYSDPFALAIVSASL